MDRLPAQAPALRRWLGRSRLAPTRRAALHYVSATPNDLGYAYRTSNDGVVRITRSGRAVTTLRGPAARRFLDDVRRAAPNAVQQACARATGNYKRGNECR